MNNRPVSVAPVFSGCSSPGTEHVNHDRRGARSRTLWVIDGATRTATTPVEKYVAALDIALTDVAGNDSLPLTELLALAIARVTDEYRAMRLSATVALARQRAQGG